MVALRGARDMGLQSSLKITVRTLSERHDNSLVEPFTLQCFNIENDARNNELLNVVRQTFAASVLRQSTARLIKLTLGKYAALDLIICAMRAT